MIYDSEIWKIDLENDLKNITDFFKNTDLNFDQQYEDRQDPEIKERDMLDVAFIKLQKFSIYSSIIIRKLIEANKISDELLGHNFPIKNFKKSNEDKVTFWNGYKIDKFYDLKNPQKSNISIKSLTDYFIHSFHFIPEYKWQQIDEKLPDDDIENLEVKELLGIHFSSDKSKNTHLSFIDFGIYLKMIESTIKDFITHLEIRDGEIIKKSSKVVPVSKEVEKLIKKVENNSG